MSCPRRLRPKCGEALLPGAEEPQKQDVQSGGMHDEDRKEREAAFHDRAYSDEIRRDVWSKEDEAAFHDRAYSDEIRSGLWSTVYRVVGSSIRFYRQYLESRCEGAAVLEYGCGVTNQALFLADRGAASVIGIDLSEVAVERGNERARSGGYDSVSFRVMDAEDLDFGDNSFDLICGGGILHHLDLSQAYSELSRVLRPSGSAIFVEPLGHNPLINLYRDRTPELRTPDEHPLLMADVEAAEEFFGTVRTRFFHLSGLAAVPFRRLSGFHRIVAALDAVDRLVFRLVPPSRKHAWMVAIELTRPGAGRAAQRQASVA
jgi:SAM-dependent methyltransferase